MAIDFRGLFRYIFWFRATAKLMAFDEIGSPEVAQSLWGYQKRRGKPL
jgi:hypothetical protein